MTTPSSDAVGRIGKPTPHQALAETNSRDPVLGRLR